MVKMENWSLMLDTPPLDPFKAPEQHRPKLRLQGNVYGHKDFPEGSFVTTSSIKEVDHGKQTVTTSSGSVYELGEPNPDYEKEFPNAKNRIFKIGKL